MQWFVASWIGVARNAVSVLLFLLLVGRSIENMLNHIKEFHEPKMTSLATKYYLPRWLGIFSRNDEAISSLQSTLFLRVQLFPKWEGRKAHVWNVDPVGFRNNVFPTFMRPINWLHDEFLTRGANKYISRRLRKTAQGDDRPAAEIFDVSTYPTSNSCLIPDLPPHIEAGIEPVVNQHIKEAGGVVREALIKSTLSSDPLSAISAHLRESLTGSELTHCGYYGSSAVVDIIAGHMCRMSETASVNVLEPASDAFLTAFHLQTALKAEETALADLSAKAEHLLNKKSSGCIMIVLLFLAVMAVSVIVPKK